MRDSDCQTTSAGQDGQQMRRWRRAQRLLVSMVSMLGLCVFGAGAAQADSDGGGQSGPQPTAINHCAYTITAPGRYVLTADLTCGPLPGVQIEASNVDFAMAGHFINSQSYDPVSAGVTTVDTHVLVRGPGEITGAPAQGLIFQNVSYSTVAGITATGNGTGLFQAFGVASHNVFIGNNTYGNVVRDILIRQGDYTSVVFNNCTSSQYGIVNGDGFEPVTNSYVAGNHCTGNTVGIDNGNGTSGTFTRNRATGNVLDLEDDQPACDANKWFENTFNTANQPCIN